MRPILKIFQSIFFTTINYILLTLGNLFTCFGCVLSNLYIPVLATVPMLIVGLVASLSVEHASLVIITVVLFLIVLSFILPFITAAYEIVLILFSSVGSLALTLGQHCFSCYKSNHNLIQLNRATLPKAVSFFFIPYFVLNTLYSVSLTLLRMFWWISIIISVGCVGYCIYSYTTNFSDEIASKLLPKLETFSTNTAWGNYVLGIMLIATILGTLIKISSDIKLQAEITIYGKELLSSTDNPQTGYS